MLCGVLSHSVVFTTRLVQLTRSRRHVDVWSRRLWAGSLGLGKKADEGEGPVRCGTARVSSMFMSWAGAAE